MGQASIRRFDSAYTRLHLKPNGTKQCRCNGWVEVLCWKLFSDCDIQKTEVHKGAFFQVMTTDIQSPNLKPKAVRLCIGFGDQWCQNFQSDCGIQKTEINKGTFFQVMTTDIQSPNLKPNAFGVAQALEISGARSKKATAVYKKRRYIRELFYDYDR